MNAGIPYKIYIFILSLSISSESFAVKTGWDPHEDDFISSDVSLGGALLYALAFYLVVLFISSLFK